MDYSARWIGRLLSQLESGDISRREAFRKLKDMPFKDIGFAKIDFHRRIRKGFPEVVFAPGKNAAQVAEIARRIIEKGNPLLITKASRILYDYLAKTMPALKFNEAAGMIYAHRGRKPVGKGFALVITAGTSDIPIAEEACLTMEIMGTRVKRLYDVGVAGIHRLVENYGLMNRAGVVIVIAGMEGALASIVGGLTARPVIAVPTSVGYGASFGGLSSLLTMLNSCAPGVCVVNIDNGFGAGYFASLIDSVRSAKARPRRR